MQRLKHSKRTLLQCTVLVISALMIAYGAIASVIMVIFILPAILLLVDRIITKKGEKQL